jgi:hypothetical protein
MPDIARTLVVWKKAAYKNVYKSKTIIFRRNVIRIIDGSPFSAFI